MELPFRIPDSFLPVLLGLGLWFGACYVYFAPELTERAIAMHVEKECLYGANPKMCSCVLTDIQTGTGQGVKNAVFLASFGLSEPRVRIWNNEQNPYIHYVSLQMSDQSRRKTCDAPTLDLVAQAEQAAQKKIAIEKEKAAKVAQQALDIQKQQYEDEMEKIRQANQQLVEDTKKQLTDVANTAKNSPIGKAIKKELKEQTAQAKRVYELKEKTAKEILNWWELGLKRSEKERRRFADRIRRRL